MSYDYLAPPTYPCPVCDADVRTDVERKACPECGAALELDADADVRNGDWVDLTKWVRS